MRIEVWRAAELARSDEPDDSYHLLLDRAWPSRVRKDELRVDEWARTLAPPRALQDNLRKKQISWPAFKAAYWEYLSQHGEEVHELARLADERRLVLLHGWNDKLQNPAIALRDFLLMQNRNSTR